MNYQPILLQDMGLLKSFRCEKCFDELQGDVPRSYQTEEEHA